MKRLPIGSEEADRAIGQMALLWEINRVFFKEASAPRRSAAAPERERLRRVQEQHENAKDPKA